MLILGYGNNIDSNVFSVTPSSFFNNLMRIDREYINSRRIQKSEKNDKNT